MKVGIIIGRFQPLHEGHIHAIETAASKVDKLIILIGSANSCRSIKNPWSYTERKIYLLKTIHYSCNIHIEPLNDYRYNDTQWISDVKNTVYNATSQDVVPTLFGHMKEGNDYLTWFPEWEFQDIPSIHSVNSTMIRSEMYESKNPLVPKTVIDDFDFYKKESELFRDYPFPETLNFNCADTVLECLGFVLVIKRLRAPGQGSWALPGGFKNANETFLECAIRELYEETNLRVPEKVIRGSIVSSKMFDSPNRSFGIPRNTFAFHIKIEPNQDGSLPRANGGDDASECRWVPIGEVLNGYNLYDDHSDIISELTGVRQIPAYLTKF